MSRYLSSVNTNVLFVTLSSITNPQTRYISFITALISSITAAPANANQPIVPILDAIAKEEDPVWTLKKELVNGIYSYLTVSLDHNLSGKYNS